MLKLSDRIFYSRFFARSKVPVFSAITFLSALGFGIFFFIDMAMMYTPLNNYLPFHFNIPKGPLVIVEEVGVLIFSIIRYAPRKRREKIVKQQSENGEKVIKAWVLFFFLCFFLYGAMFLPVFWHR